MAKRNPTQTRERILAAAIEEFSKNGLEGARVDMIAERAGANKRMLYHYFGNKEDLFLATLEAVYVHIRSHERELKLEDQTPEAAMRVLASYTFDYYIDNPHFIRLLNNENLHEAAHLKRSKSIREMHSPLVQLIRDALDRGVAAGTFRDGVDPIQLYISIAGLAYFYMSNSHTLSTIFGRNLSTAAALKKRREHIAEVILGYLRP